MEEKKIEEVESLGLHPCVTLVVVDDFGCVKLLEHIGEENFAGFLSIAAQIESNPIAIDSFLLDCRGQEIYTLSDYDYFKSISGFFLTISNVKELVNACHSDNLKFTFIVSY